LRTISIITDGETTVTAQQNHFADFADLARRGQDTASDVLGLWNSTIQTGNEQTRNLQRVADDLFSLADHSLIAGREYVNYLSAVLKVSAAGLDTVRELTNTTLKAFQSSTEWLADAGR
jgi:hypothetical protein